MARTHIETTNHSRLFGASSTNFRLKIHSQPTVSLQSVFAQREEQLHLAIHQHQLAQGRAAEFQQAAAQADHKLSLSSSEDHLHGHAQNALARIRANVGT
jgi:hypothetical protein